MSTPLLICRVALAVPLPRSFDYLAPDNIEPIELQPGIRLWVPFNNRRKVAVLLEVDSQTDVDDAKLKRVESIIDEAPLLSGCDLALLHWASRYYHHPIGEVMAAAFPVALRQGKAAKLNHPPHYALSDLGRVTTAEQLKRSPKQQALLTLMHRAANPLTADHLSEHKAALKALQAKGLIERCDQPESPARCVINPPLPANPEQQAAIDSIVGSLGRFSVTLLEGITGSGKTEVYLQAIAEVLARGQQVLLLLPEITLTPQLELRFRQRFATGIVTSHSKLTDQQRLDAWLQMQQGRAAIMLGTRSALFTPMRHPGLIVLDEEHDSSFKQQDGFRFSARDVAVVRGKQLGIPVLLGTATPALETLFNVAQGRYRRLHLPSRAGTASMPSQHLLDIRNKKLQSGLSEPLIEAMRQTLAQGRQVLLFLNRRGYAPVQICHGCGWLSRCQRCDANLVIHAAERRLRCHHCGSEQALSRQCPGCKGEMQAVGLGTERIEQTLAELFPDHLTVRLDRDTTQRKGTLENYLEQIQQGHADIILGTQMLAKGHHFPAVTLVAIVDIDSGLFSIDYHASEKLAQMIVQVSGRAGRAEQPGRVLLQTRQPQHPLLTTLLSQGYAAFADVALRERQQAGLPPYAHQALFRAHANDRQAAQAFLQAAVESLKQHAIAQVQLLGPVAAPMARRDAQYHYQLLLQSQQRKQLHRLLDLALPQIYQSKEASKVRWSLDVDPLDLY